MAFKIQVHQLSDKLMLAADVPIGVPLRVEL